MTLKKSGFLKIFAILLFALICVAAAIVTPIPANAATSTSETVNPYAIPDGSAALITYERYQTGIIGFQYTLSFDDAHKNPELLAKATELMNIDYADTGWVAEAEEDGSMLYFGLSFDSVTDYYIAAGITGFDPPEDDDDSEGITTKTTAFYVYTTNETETVFANKDDTPVAYLEIVAATCGVPQDKVSYKYFYATKYKKAFTSNAEQVLNYNEFKLHIFDIPSDNLGKKISITSCNPNPDSWYLLAIGVGVLVAVATGVVIAVNYRKKKED